MKGLTISDMRQIAQFIREDGNLTRELIRAGLNWREYAKETPVAISVLATGYDPEIGEWYYQVLDPGYVALGVTHWIPLGELATPTVYIGTITI